MALTQQEATACEMITRACRKYIDGGVPTSQREKKDNREWEMFKILVSGVEPKVLLNEGELRKFIYASKAIVKMFNES